MDAAAFVRFEPRILLLHGLRGEQAGGVGQRFFGGHPQLDSVCKL